MALTPEQRAELILQALNKDTASDKDMAMVVELLFSTLDKVRENQDQKIDNVKKTLDKEDVNLGNRIAQVKGEAEASVITLRKLVDKLLLWKQTQDESTVESTVSELGGLIDENSADIARVRSSVETLKKAPGAPGKAGKPPAHEWDDTKLRFENPDGTWGDWVDLKGDPGVIERIVGGDSGWGSSMGIQSIKPGSSNVHISGDGANVRISVDPSSGGSLAIEAPPEAPDDTTVLFTFSTKPFQVVMNGSSYRENHGWTWTGTQASMFSPVGTGGDIYAIIQS